MKEANGVHNKGSARQPSPSRKGGDLLVKSTPPEAGLQTPRVPKVI